MTPIDGQLIARRFIRREDRRLGFPGADEMFERDSWRGSLRQSSIALDVELHRIGRAFLRAFRPVLRRLR